MTVNSDFLYTQHARAREHTHAHTHVHARIHTHTHTNYIFTIATKCTQFFHVYLPLSCKLHQVSSWVDIAQYV
jgi:hypothetical protein